MEHREIEWFFAGNQRCQTRYIVSPYLFTLYAEHTIQKTRLDSEERVKIGGKHINTLRYADDTSNDLK